MDLTYKEAVRNDSIPFELYAPTCATLGGALIDAVYVPTQGHRPLLETSCQVLKKHAKSVHLLFSEKKAKWVDELDHPEIHVYEHIQKQRSVSSFVYESSYNPSTQYKPLYDIPYKRNLSLIDAFRNDYKTICLLDDDIDLGDREFGVARHALDDGVDIGSFHVLNYPDVSTVDHMERIITKKPSRVSIGGNCLFLKMSAVKSFFPDAYNDDWFFIFSHMYKSRIVSLGTAPQRPYAPWLDMDRIAFEQFGDIIIEGAKLNIANRRMAFSGNSSYWDGVQKAYIDRLKTLSSLPESGTFSNQLTHAINVARTIQNYDFIKFLKTYANEQSHAFYQEIVEAENECHRETNILKN